MIVGPASSTRINGDTTNTVGKSHFSPSPRHVIARTAAAMAKNANKAE